MADTLLDAIVEISIDPNSPVEQQLQDFFTRIQAQFGAMGKSWGETLAGGVAGGSRKGASGVRSQLDEFRKALLIFKRDVQDVDVRISLLGDRDIAARLQAIKKQKTEAEASFAIARSERDVSGQLEQIQVVERLTEEMRNLGRETRAANDALGQTPVSNTLNAQLDAARNSAQGVRQELLAIRNLTISAKDEGLSREFQNAREEANRLINTVGQLANQRDILGAQNTLNALQGVVKTLGDIRNRANDKIALNIDIGTFNRQFAEQLRDVKTNAARDVSLTRGSLSGDDRQALAVMQHEFDSLVNGIKTFNAELNKTPETLQRMIANASRINEVSEQMHLLRTSTQSVLSPMNSLTNNAYQLGQAIEDFSVGFELNGLKGGIRGAANNISFLVNNLAQGLEKSDRISAGLKTTLALSSGIGSALAILVLPRLVEWLQTLNDVESKTKDISEVIKREFANAQFRVSLKYDSIGFKRAINEAKTADDALKELIKRQEEAAKHLGEVTSTITLFSEGQSIKGMEETLKTIEDAARVRLKDMQQRFNDPKFITPGGLDPFGQPLPDVKVPASAADIAKRIKDAEELNELFVQGIINANKALADMQKLAKNGVLPDDEAAAFHKQIIQIVDEFKKLEELGAFPDPAKAPTKANLEAVLDIIKDIDEQSQKAFQSQSDVNTFGLDQAILKASRLSAEYQFLQDVAAGRRYQEERLLFDQQQETKELERQLELVEKLAKEQGTDLTTVLKLRNQLKLNKLAEDNIDLQTRNNEILQQLQGNKKGGNVSFKDFALNVISGGDTETQKLIRELQLNTQALRNNNRAAGGIPRPGPGGFVPNAPLDERRSRRFRLPRPPRESGGADLHRTEQEIVDEARSATAAAEAAFVAARELNEGVTGFQHTINEIKNMEALIEARAEIDLKSMEARAASGIQLRRPAIPRAPRQLSPKEQLDKSESDVRKALQASKKSLRDALGAEQELQFAQKKKDKAAAMELPRDERSAALKRLEDNSREAQAEILEHHNRILQETIQAHELYLQQIEKARAELENKSKPLPQGPAPNAGQPFGIDVTRAANEQAIQQGIDNANFTSDTIEALIAVSNKALLAINESITKLDTTARLA